MLADGTAATVAVGTVTTGSAGTSASISNSGDSNAAVLDFTIPKGDKGNTGTISVGTVTTGAAGSSAAVEARGTDSDKVLDFTIPKGDKGDAATVEVGAVTTGAAGSSVAVTNSGNSGAAVLNFTIPKGDVGATGYLTEAVAYDEAVAYPYLKLVSYGTPANLYQVIDENGTTAGDTPVSAAAKFILVAEHGAQGNAGGVVHIIGVWNAQTTYNINGGVSDGVRGNGGVFATKQNGNLNHALPTAEAGENDWWVLIMADSQVYGANCVMAPTVPVSPFDGLIWIKGNDPENIDVHLLDVEKSSTEPATPANGTIWIKTA